MKKFVISLISIIVLFFLGFLLSFKYQLETSNSNLYKLNRITGNVQMIDGTRTIEVLKPSDKPLSIKFEPREIGNKNFSAKLSTTWRNGKLYYNFEVSPFTDGLKKVYETATYDKFTLYLLDSEEYTITTIGIPLSKMIGRQGWSNSIEALHNTGSISMSFEDARIIRDWNISWNF